MINVNEPTIIATLSAKINKTRKHPSIIFSPRAQIALHPNLVYIKLYYFATPTAITPQEYPNLPRSIEVPMVSEASAASAASDGVSSSQSQSQFQSRLDAHGNPSITATTPRGAGTNRRGRY